MSTRSSASVVADEHRRLQRRVVGVLATGQVLGGLGTGAALSLGALLITDVAGSSAWSGMAATMGTLGAATFAVPLARLAQTKGRRVSLSTGGFLAVLGGAVVVGAALLGSLWMLLLGILLMGSAQALNLQARFAATDLATPTTRGRDLSLVVWATTVGAVAGPNLFEPGEAIGDLLGLPTLTGGFVIAAVTQSLGAVVYLVGLRPDPLLTAAHASKAADDAAEAARSGPGAGGDAAPVGRPSGGFAVLRSSPAARRAVLTVALSHTVMVALMSMTPVHLTEHGASLTMVGFTISLHVAGMYALSPVFGHLTDRLGPRVVVVGGQVLLAVSLVLSLVGSEVAGFVTASLVLLGLGWSASVVAGSAMVSTAVAPAQRPRLQGVSDSLMSLAGAAGGALAGPVLARIGFDGLAATLLALVVVVLAQRRPLQPAAAQD